MDSDDDGISNERVGFDGSPMPSVHHHDGDGPDVHWNHLTTLSLAPLQYTESGVGGALSYERALDVDGIVSAYVPFIAAFSLRGDRDRYYNYNNYNSYNYGGYYGNTLESRNSYMLYAMPGIKFYPTGMGHVKYAIGPNAVIGWGQRKESGYVYAYPTYDPGYPYTTYVAPTYYNSTYSRLLVGMMINNSLNIQATPHLHIGVEMGFGFTYYDRIGSVNEGSKFLTQGNFNMGYTF